MHKAPVLFLSHGSPARVLENSPAAKFLKELPNKLPTIKGIVIISPHWETQGLQFTQKETLDNINSFYGFSPALSNINYSVNNPTWLQNALKQQLCHNDVMPTSRGLDHGAWSLLYLMYPNSEIPTVGLSLPSPTSLLSLYELGQTLADLREQGIMIIASGMATHNLRTLTPKNIRQPWADQFVNWLHSQVAEKNLRALLHYREEAPYGSFAHPRDEHLRPLFIALGAAGNDNGKLIHDSWENGTGNNSSWAWGL